MLLMKQILLGQRIWDCVQSLATTYNVVAVMKLHSSSKNVDHNGFLNEIRALIIIRHRHIMKLYGYCFHSRHSFFISENLEKGSLGSILRSDVLDKELDWLKRVNIVKTIANGFGLYKSG
ncbi:unnamed protein product [Lactuca virosa]|uniref:non-specific serine/threonine protein kinase n=1 Tax=Lactuca virosa TaxID=75947 RepID=A0AAU9LD69_9ASTR|nr:unnamed protein product [Lactuca virosa]